MILKKSVPFSGSPVLLSGTEFSDIQKFLLSGFATTEISLALGEQNLRFKSSWITVGGKYQITPINRQPGQSRLIVPLSDSAYVICYASSFSDPIVFRLMSGTAEAVWVPESFYQGFYFSAQKSLFLTIGTTERNLESVQSFNPLDKSHNIDLSQIVPKQAIAAPLVEV